MKSLFAVFAIFTSLSALASKGFPTADELRIEAESALQVASHQLKEPSLYSITLERHASGPCASQVSRIFRFADDQSVKSVMMIAYLYKAAPAGCRLVRMTDLRKVPHLPGFQTYDIAAVNVAPVEAYRRVLDKAPLFRWDGRFQLIKDLNHGEHPFYVLQGTLNGMPTSYTIGAVQQ